MIEVMTAYWDRRELAEAINDLLDEIDRLNEQVHLFKHLPFNQYNNTEPPRKPEPWHPDGWFSIGATPDEIERQRAVYQAWLKEPVRHPHEGPVRGEQDQRDTDQEA
jgi:hypothetical protein